MKLKNLLCVLSIIALMPISISAQLSSVDLSGKDVVYYGIDFTAAKMVGTEGFSNPYDIVHSYFSKWNSLVLTERDKYDLKKALHISAFSYDLTPVEEHNKTIDHNGLVINSMHHISSDDVANVIDSLDLSGSSIKEGIGFIFVVESFNKFDEKGAMWCTLFDISTKKILATDRFEGKSGGFGLRNYWAKSIHGVMINMGKAK